MDDNYIVNPLAKRDLYLPSINNFFNDTKNELYKNYFMKILSGEKFDQINKKISISQIERFILKDNYGTEIHTNYIMQLNEYTKKYFDPICRQQMDPSFTYKFGDGTHCITNIKQLNFFVWFFKMGIFDKLIKKLEENKINKPKKNKKNK